MALPAGSTPVSVYRELVRLHKEEGADFSSVVAFNVDEYVGIATDKPPKVKKSKRQPASDRKSKKVSVETLYNLRDDVGEQHNLIARHTEIVARLKKRMENFHSELRNNTRPAGIANRDENQE